MTPGQILEQIARDHLSIPTLHARNSDSLDFHVLAVRSISEALRAAYEAGIEAGRSRKKPPR